ncbi:MAG: hypothetical protein II949_14595 [Prevotella sp.]|nr:hypothetical protein [Prevotella sp.]
MKTMRSQPRRGVTVLASHIWLVSEGCGDERAVGTRQHCALVAYLKARFPRPVFFPAISQPLRGSCMAGYHCLMPRHRLRRNV